MYWRFPYAACFVQDILASTVSHPTTLNEHIAEIQAILPRGSSPLRAMDVLLAEQDSTATEMASRLEDLTAHFDQMSRALRDEESGHSLSEDDMLGQHVRYPILSPH